MDEKQMEWADRLVRRLALEECLSPVDVEAGELVDCGEVFICGGKCVRCLAVLYVDRYPKPVEA